MLWYWKWNSSIIGRHIQEQLLSSLRVPDFYYPSNRFEIPLTWCLWLPSYFVLHPCMKIIKYTLYIFKDRYCIQKQRFSKCWVGSIFYITYISQIIYIWYMYMHYLSCYIIFNMVRFQISYGPCIFCFSVFTTTSTSVRSTSVSSE